MSDVLSKVPGKWRAETGQGYNSRPFWNVMRSNENLDFRCEYLCTKFGAKRFYLEAKAIAAAEKLNEAGDA